MGKCVRILYAINGLKRANQLFSQEFTRVVVSAGLKQYVVEQQIYVRSDPVDPELKCVAAVTVDDVLVSDGWTAPRRSARAVNPNYVHGEMPPLNL